MNFNKLIVSKLAGGAPAMDLATLVSMPMSGRNAHRRGLLSRCLTLAGAAVLAGSLFGQGNSGSAPGSAGRPEDWSHHHVVFSPPRSPQAAVALQKDPRYQQQVLRRGASASTNQGSKTPPTPPPTGDWSVSMGRTGSRVTPAMFPAKYSFGITNADCADFAVFADDQPALARASGRIVLGPQLANGDTLTITGSPARTYTFVTVPPILPGQVFIGPSQNATADNLASAINGTGTPGTDYGIGTTVNVDVSAVSGGGTTGQVILTARAPGTSGNTITLTTNAAKNHIDIAPDQGGPNPSSITLTGGGSTLQSTIFAINNLYAGGSDVAASATGTFTTTAPTAGQTATITNGANSITLTSNIATRATGTGTFSGNVRNSGNVTVTNGGNTVTLTPSATPGQITGTFLGSVSGTVTTTALAVGANTLNLTDGRATGSGAFSAPLCIKTNQGVTVNGVSLTTVAAMATGSITIGTNPSAGNNVVINGPNTPTAQTYTFRTTVGTTANEVLIGGTSSLSAANLGAAINGDSTQCSNAPSACFGSLTAANANVTAPSVSTNVVSLSAKCAGTAYNVAISDNTGNITESGMTGGSNGTNGSPASTNFAVSTVTGTMATNLSGRINANVGGVTSSVTGSTVNLAALTPGSAGNSIGLAETFTSGFSWSGGTLTNGSDANACTDATHGNFVNSSTPASAATNLTAAIGDCINNFAALAASVQQGTGGNNNKVTVTASTPGSDITVSGTPNLGNFTWAATAGTNITGSAGCSGVAPNFTGTFAISNTNSTEAASLVTALNACPIAAGITAAQGTGGNTNQVIVTARTPGTAGNSITLNESLTSFIWSNGTNQTPPAVNLSGGAGNDTGANFSVAPSTVTTADLTYDAANLAAAIARSGGTVGVTATSAGAVVTVTATSFGAAGNLIALSEGMVNFSWANSNLQGGNAAGGCPGPTVTWAYNASASPPAAGSISTSPVLSLDGTKVAFMENVFGGAVLHVLRPKPEGSVTLPNSPGTTTSDGGTWTGCLNGNTSCMFNLTIGSSGNTNSSPFPGYVGDVLYVGDDNGQLWKITGVFNGTPALAGAPWPITVNSGRRLTGPVFDFTSQNIFVADDSGRLSFVREVGSTTGLCAGSPPCLGLTNITLNNTMKLPITDSPILDTELGKVFVFAGSNGTNAVVVQANTDLTGQVTANVGQASTTQVHAGTFDNNYYSNGPSNGRLYVCGKASGTSQPVLYRFGFTGNNLNTSTDGTLPLTTTQNVAAECSPLSEIFNPNQGGGIDWLFAGVPGSCIVGGSSTGCVMSFNITSAFPTTASFAGEEGGGASGIIVDNVSPDGQASSLYYSTLSDDAKCGTGGCAVKRTQAGLQ